MPCSLVRRASCITSFPQCASGVMAAAYLSRFPGRQALAWICWPL